MCVAIVPVVKASDFEYNDLVLHKIKDLHPILNTTVNNLALCPFIRKIVILAPAKARNAFQGSPISYSKGNKITDVELFKKPISFSFYEESLLAGLYDAALVSESEDFLITYAGAALIQPEVYDDFLKEVYVSGYNLATIDLPQNLITYMKFWQVGSLFMESNKDLERASLDSFLNINAKIIPSALFSHTSVEDLRTMFLGNPLEFTELADFALQEWALEQLQDGSAWTDICEALSKDSKSSENTDGIKKDI